MPRYSYRCEPCVVDFEVVRSFADSDKPAACPSCEQEARRLMTTPLTTFTRGGAAAAMRASRQNAPAPPSGGGFSHFGHTHGPGAGSHSH